MKRVFWVGLCAAAVTIVSAQAAQASCDSLHSKGGALKGPVAWSLFKVSNSNFICSIGAGPTASAAFVLAQQRCMAAVSRAKPKVPGRCVTKMIHG